MFNVAEKYISRRFERSVQSQVKEVKYRLKWVGAGSEDPDDAYDEDVAYAAFKAVLPTTKAGDDGQVLYLDTITVDEEEMGTGKWNGYARYVPNTIQLAIGQERRTFNSSGGTQHITLSRETTESKAASGTPPNYGRLIGVRPDGTPEGTDIMVPVHEYEITRAFADDDIDQSYEQLLVDATYTTNASTFRGGGAKTVLFMGATGGQRGDGVAEITFKFAAAKDRTGVTIPGADGTITMSMIGAWECFWVAYVKKKLGTGANANVGDVPKYAYAERVYDSTDFSDLGINT